MSATRLLVLGVVRGYGRVHGYRVGAELLSWGAGEWANVKWGSIYHALRQATRAGFLRDHDDVPGRTDYELTERGEAEFQHLLRDALRQPQPRPDLRVSPPREGISMPEKIAPPRWLKPVNAALLVARRLGLGWAREMPVLVLPGRKTGKLRRTPVTPLDLDGQRYLVAGFPGSDWAANARALSSRGGVGILLVGRREDRVRLVELSPADAVPILRAWPVRIPQGAKIMRDGGVVPDLEPDTFAALAGRCAVFRIEAV